MKAYILFCLLVFWTAQGSETNVIVDLAKTPGLSSQSASPTNSTSRLYDFSAPVPLKGEVPNEKTYTLLLTKELEEEIVQLKPHYHGVEYEGAKISALKLPAESCMLVRWCLRVGVDTVCTISFEKNDERLHEWAVFTGLEWGL